MSNGQFWQPCSNYVTGIFSWLSVHVLEKHLNCLLMADGDSVIPQDVHVVPDKFVSAPHEQSDLVAFPRTRIRVEKCDSDIVCLTNLIKGCCPTGA